MAAGGVRALATLIWGTPEENGKTYEVIDGELYVYPIPWWTHQLQLSNLSLFVSKWVHEHNLGYVVGARTSVVLDEYTGVQPDLLYISYGRKHVIAKWGVDGPPDLIVEVLSAWTEERDRGIKLHRYAASGVAHYWILDADGPRIEERVLGDDGYRLVGPSALATSSTRHSSRTWISPSMKSPTEGASRRVVSGDREDGEDVQVER